MFWAFRLSPLSELSATAIPPFHCRDVLQVSILWEETLRWKTRLRSTTGRCIENLLQTICCKSSA